MSDVTVISGAGTPVTAVPAKKLTAIEIIEQEIATYFQQREQAVANVHALDGAIKSSQNLVEKLKVHAAKAEAGIKKLVEEIKTEI